jgi:N-acetylneuraminate synthase
MLISYAKGARTFERHIDINSDGKEVALYSSLPEQMDTWYKTFNRAKVMCGVTGRRKELERETAYLDSYIRGVYARRPLVVGQQLTEDDIYLAIPLQKGQISCRELMLGRFGHVVTQSCSPDAPLMIDAIDSPYANNEALKQQIYNRGL